MRSPLILTLCLLLTACTAIESSNPEEERPDITGIVWELSNIQSMDDSTYVPRAQGLYTLELHKDNSVAVRADCNRGRGTWSSETASSISISQLATTRALCVPPSLHDRFLSDLNNTRSYVLKDGRLYLSTKADGAILEFTPGIVR